MPHPSDYSRPPLETPTTIIPRHPMISSEATVTMVLTKLISQLQLAHGRQLCQTMLNDLRRRVIHDVYVRGLSFAEITNEAYNAN